jgi:hypothetical protein
MSKQKKQNKKQKEEKPSASAAAQVAGFLVKNYPKDAMKIASGMESATNGKSMRRRLGRITKAVASASASAAA